MSERFIIEKQISARKSADAYLAFDTKTDRKVRLRRIHSQMTPEQLESVSEAFLVTQRQLALVKSDLITHITESGIDEQGAWLSLPYYESEQLLNAHTLPISLPEFHNLATQLFTGLKAVHEENLVHGALNTNSIDVLPPEIPNGRISYCIRDLGMRRLLVLVQNPTALASLPSDVATLAPELFNSLDAEPNSDLYMAGHLLYYLVAGGHPFVGLDNDTALKMHLAHDIAPAHTINPDIPTEVSEWLDKLTQPAPKDRFQSAEDALAALPFIAPDIKKQPTALVYNSLGKLTAAHSIQAEKMGRSRKLPAYLYIIGVLALAALIGLYFIFRSDDASGTAKQTPPPVKKVFTVEIQPVASGVVTGADLGVSNADFRIGTSVRGATPWGKGKSEDAFGPDLGASYRAFIVFKIADIIDAEAKDSLVNVGSLKGLKLELSFNKKSSVTFLPMLYKPEILKKRSHASVRAESQDLENGILPVIKDRTFTFTLSNVDMSDALYDQHFVFMLTASKKPKNGEILEFARTTIKLKVIK